MPFKSINPNPNVSTTPIMAMGCQECLPVSVVQLKGKHCQNPIVVLGLQIQFIGIFSPFTSNKTLKIPFFIFYRTLAAELTIIFNFCLVERTKLSLNYFNTLLLQVSSQQAIIRPDLHQTDQLIENFTITKYFLNPKKTRAFGRCSFRRNDVCATNFFFK